MVPNIAKKKQTANYFYDYFIIDNDLALFCDKYTNRAKSYRGIS